MNNFKRELICEMGNNNLEPYDDLIFDGQPHKYEAYINGEHIPARYTATLYPFDSMHNGPVLICQYGLINDKAQYTYSSSVNQK